MNEPRREIEAKLVAPGETAASRARVLVEGSWIGEVELGRLTVQRFRDRYFDTREGLLARTGVALRTRSEARSTTVTLKGRAASVPGGLSRLEVEGEWAPSTLATIAPHLPVGPIGFDPQPEVAFARADLGVIQDRVTVRRSRVAAWRGRTCAEISLDEVDFEAATGIMRLVELEVELLDGVSGEVLPDLVGAIRTAAPELLPWRHSKLATGLAVCALAAGESPRSGGLDAADLERIAAWIGSRALD